VSLKPTHHITYFIYVIQFDVNIAFKTNDGTVLSLKALPFFPIEYVVLN